LTKLELHQSTFHHNLSVFGKELTNLKELTIDHHGSTDLRLFKSLELLPDLITLNVFRVFHKVQNSGSFRTYSISSIVEAWIESSKKSKSTLIQLNATYTFDVDFKISNSELCLITTMDDASAELIDKI